MPAPKELTTRTLKAHAWAKGFDGATGLARRLGRRRETLYHAIRNPARYKPTIRAIQQALGIK